MIDPRPESPIEWLLFDALARGGSDCWDRFGFARSTEGLPKGGAWVIPQAPVGKYRVDFLLVAWRCREECGDPFCTEHRISVAIECDGHEWHERTPEQAQRDKKRDRDIQAAGISVLRFTAAEIRQEALFCAYEIQRIAYGLAGLYDHNEAAAPG